MLELTEEAKRLIWQKKFEDGKPIGGKGRLTLKETGKLQTFWLGNKEDCWEHFENERSYWCTSSPQIVT